MIEVLFSQIQTFRKSIDSLESLKIDLFLNECLYSEFSKFPEMQKKLELNFDKRLDQDIIVKYTLISINYMIQIHHNQLFIKENRFNYLKHKFEKILESNILRIIIYRYQNGINLQR